MKNYIKDYFKYKLNEAREYDVPDNVELGLFKGLKNSFTKNDWDRRPIPNAPAGLYNVRRRYEGIIPSSRIQPPLVNYSKKDAYIRAGALGALATGVVALTAYDNYKNRKRWREEGCSNEIPELKPLCQKYLKKLKNKK